MLTHSLAAKAVTAAVLAVFGSVSVAQSPLQEAYLKAWNSDERDQFGSAVAIDGTTAVVTSFWEQSDGTSPGNNDFLLAGAAYVFQKIGATWTQQAYLKPDLPFPAEAFGWSVAIDGDRIVIGAVGNDSAATGVNGDTTNQGAVDSGAAYVFVRQGNTFVQEAFLKSSDPETGDVFGHAVAIDGDTIVVGARFEESSSTGVGGDPFDNGAPGSGSVHVFRRVNGAWQPEAFLKASNTDVDDRFGQDVAIDGNVIVVGAYQEDGGPGGAGTNVDTDSGAAYVFEHDGSAWNQIQYLKAPNSEAGDGFGYTVEVQGDTLLVGAIGESGGSNLVNGNQTDNSMPEAGAVYVFERNAGSWQFSTYLKAFDNDDCYPDSFNNNNGRGFGGSAALGTDYLVVGSSREDSGYVHASVHPFGPFDRSRPRAGAAYVFRRASGGWAPHQFLKRHFSGRSDYTGRDVAIAGGTVLVGTPGDDSPSTFIDGSSQDNSGHNNGSATVFQVAGAASALERRTCTNPATYDAERPVLGQTWTGSVDTAATGHSAAWIFSFSSTATIPVPIGQSLLTVGLNERLALAPLIGAPATFQLNVPNDTSLVGRTFPTQAAVFGGGIPWEFTNAQDLTLGL